MLCIKTSTVPESEVLTLAVGSENALDRHLQSDRLLCATEDSSVFHQYHGSIRNRQGVLTLKAHDGEVGQIYVDPSKHATKDTSISHDIDML